MQEQTNLAWVMQLLHNTLVEAGPCCAVLCCVVNIVAVVIDSIHMCLVLLFLP